MSHPNQKHPMQLAIESALVGIKDNDGGPFGACIVKENQVIAVAHNTVLKENDPTCHAEMNAIRLAAKTLGTYVLSGCELYTTVDPCPMCLAAIYWARIDKIIAGCENIIAARYGFDDDAFHQEIKKTPNERAITTEIGMLAKESEEVFKVWQKLGRKLY